MTQMNVHSWEVQSQKLSMWYVSKRQSRDHLVEGWGGGELSASRGLAAKASQASRRRSMPLQPSEFLVGEGLKLCTTQW